MQVPKAITETAGADMFGDSDFGKVMPTNYDQVRFAVKFLQSGNKGF